MVAKKAAKETEKTNDETEKTKEAESEGDEPTTERLEVEGNQVQSKETENSPLSPGDLIGLSREIEKMVGNALGDVTKVKVLITKLHFCLRSALHLLI